MKALWRSAELILVALIIGNIAGLGYFFVLRRQAGLYAPGSRFPLPAGYTLSGKRLPAGGYQCYLIRVSAAGCPYCSADQSRLDKLISRAHDQRCQVIYLAPKVGEMLPDNDPNAPVQLQYVDMEFARSVIPFEVPQTLLLDRGGRLLWSRIGSLDHAAEVGALKALAETP